MPAIAIRTDRQAVSAFRALAVLLCSRSISEPDAIWDIRPAPGDVRCQGETGSTFAVHRMRAPWSSPVFVDT